MSFGDVEVTRNNGIRLVGRGQECQKLGIEDCDATESKGTVCGSGRLNPFGLAGVEVGPACKKLVAVEQKEPGGVPVRHGKGGHIFVTHVGLLHGMEINGRKDIDVMDKDGFDRIEEWFGLFQSSTRVEKHFGLVGDDYICVPLC